MDFHLVFYWINARRTYNDNVIIIHIACTNTIKEEMQYNFVTDDRNWAKSNGIIKDTCKDHLEPQSLPENPFSLLLFPPPPPFCCCRRDCCHFAAAAVAACQSALDFLASILTLSSVPCLFPTIQRIGPPQLRLPLAPCHAQQLIITSNTTTLDILKFISSHPLFQFRAFSAVDHKRILKCTCNCNMICNNKLE